MNKRSDKLGLGATGKFPAGKLGPDDEGELRFGIARDPATGLIHFDFGKPVAWFAVPTEWAVDFATRILRLVPGVLKVTIEFESGRTMVAKRDDN